MTGQSMLWTQSTVLAGSRRASCTRAFQTCRSSTRKGGARRGLQTTMAADVAAQSFDLKGILEESLKAPLKSSKAAAPGPSPPPVPVPIPEPPSQPPQIPQTQTLAPMSGAGSSVEEAIRSTSTVDAALAAPPSQAAAGMTGTADGAASSLGDKALEGASQLAQQGGSLPDTAASASQAASQPIDAAASEAASQAAASAPKFTQGSAYEAYMEATKSAKKGFKAATPEPPSGSSLQEGLNSAQDAASSAISSLTEGVSSQAKAALGAASEAASGARAAASEALDSLNQATSGAVDSASAALKDLSSGFNEAGTSLQDGARAAASAAGSAFDSASANLPEPVRDALLAAKGPVSSAITQVTSSPPLLAGAAALAVGLPAAGYIRDRLGGYSGQLPPARALELLQSDNAILLDMRSDEERERDGTAALTAGAIGRGAAVPLPYISGPLSRNVRNADELAYQIAATVASGLVQLRPRAKVVVMDARGSKRAVRLARTLLASGISQAHIVQGGYRAWINAGLPTKDSADYAASPVDVISERLSGVTTAATGSLGRPALVLAAVAASGVLYLSIFDTLLLLRWLGTFAILFTAFNRVVSYSSPSDFVADVKGIGKPFAWVGSQVSGLLPRPTTDQVMLPEGAEETPMDLDAGVEQAGAAIAGAQQAGQQAIAAAAETLENKQEESQNAGAEPVEKNK